MSLDSIPKRVLDQGDRRPDAPAHYVKSRGAWRAISYRSYAEEVKRVGRALISLGFEVGDTVSLLGFNRPEWVSMFVGAMAAGGAGAGIYTTCSASEVGYILAHAESKLVLVESVEQWKKLEDQLESFPKLQKIVLYKDCPAVEHDKVLSWEAFMKLSDSASEQRLLERMHALEPDGLASLIYTSGTTGPPKGVMLSHRNLTFTADVAKSMLDLRTSEVSLSYLPLSHIAEQVFTVHGPSSFGGSVYFAESLEKVPDNLKEVQPTLFFGVPRIWEKFFAGIRAKLDTATGAKKTLVNWAQRVGSQVSSLRCRGQEPSGLLAIEYKLASKLVFSKLKPALGLGRARVCVSGAAPIAKEILQFFAGLDVMVLEVYGQSEDTGPTSFNLPDRARFGTVGPAVPGVSVKIADDGEILVKGDNVFLGYFKEPEATAETLVDGWLHSGDLGSFDADGFLSITGRKKDIIITAGGKNIAPKNIEASLKNHKLISEAVVIGDRRKFLSALITLDPEAAIAFAKEKGIGEGNLHEAELVKEEVSRAVDEVNRELARVETVKKFTVLKRPFGVDTGELTPTLKVKRKIVNENFAAEIEAMYAE